MIYFFKVFYTTFTLKLLIEGVGDEENDGNVFLDIIIIFDRTDSFTIQQGGFEWVG